MVENESYISVFVRDMRVSVRIGLLDFEKDAPQNLDVSVELFATPDYLAKSLAGDIIDYSKIYDFIKAFEDRPHTELLETLLQDMLAFGFGLPHVTAMACSISKPDIFDQAQQGGISARMTRDDFNAL